jgi:hypothetical protein
MAKGNPSYNEHVHPHICEKLAAKGATVLEIAKVLGVTDRTLFRWQKKYPELRQALKTGKQGPDDNVERSLYQRAIGFTGEDGKYYAPDVTACIFWLKNRRPEQWRDRKDLDFSGPIELVVTYEQSQS